jgi:tetratricopeptide (TPR) repeat protein
VLIRRDYSQPFFGSKRKRRGGRRGLLLFFLVILGVGAFAFTHRGPLTLAVLNAMGQAPTPTAGPTDLISQARALRAQGDYTGAAPIYEQALAMNPEEVDWIYEYGLLLIDLENYPAAVEWGEKSIGIDSFNPLGYTLKARGLIWGGDAGAAIPIALTGLNVDGQFAPLYAMLGRAYTVSGNINAGIENAEKGVAIDPGSVESRRALAFSLNYAAEYDAATQELETAMMLEPGNVSIAMELAFQYLSLNRDEEAIDVYNSVLRMQPRNSRAMLRLCRAYRKVGQFDEALTQCENAVRADPTYTAAQFQLGLLRYSEPYRDFATSRENFEVCVQLEPSNIECLFRLGLTHYYLYLAGGGTELCTSAWDMLNQARQMAEGRQNIDATKADIASGLEHVDRDCPGNLSAQIGLEGLRPAVLETPVPTPIPPTPEPGA